MKRIVLAFLFAAVVVVSNWAQVQRPSARSGERAQETRKLKADPFQQFRYRMAYPGQSQYLAGFSKVHASGGSSGGSGRNRPPGQASGGEKYEEITLERGLTQDSSFTQWANRGQAKPLAKDLVIDVFNEAGQVSSTMKLGRCVVTEFQSVPDLDGPAHSVAIQAMTLHCAGMVRSTR